MGIGDLFVSGDGGEGAARDRRGGRVRAPSGIESRAKDFPLATVFGSSSDRSMSELSKREVLESSATVEMLAPLVRECTVRGGMGGFSWSRFVPLGGGGWGSSRRERDVDGSLTDSLGWGRWMEEVVLTLVGRTVRGVGWCLDRVKESIDRDLRRPALQTTLGRRR